MIEKQRVQSESKVFGKENNLKLLLLCLGVWLHAASSMLAATTLPSAIKEFGGGNLIGWAFSLYLLGSILAGASAARLVSFNGLRKAMIVAAIVYAIGSTVCALSPNMEQMLLGRLLQGIGGGYLVALAYVAIRHWFDQHLLTKVMALISAVWSISAFTGPLMGGAFATFSDWRIAFLAAVGQALLFIALVITVAPTLKHHNVTKGISLPAMRLLLISATVLAIALAGVQVDLVRSPLWVFLGCLCFTLALKIDKRSHDRLFPSKILHIKSSVGAGLILIFCASISSMSFLVYGPLLLQNLYQVTPLTAGMIVAFESVCWGAASVVVAMYKQPNDSWLIRIGVLLLPLSLLGYSLTIGHYSIGFIVLLAGVQGMGFGMMWAFIVKRVTQAALSDEIDITSSAIPTIQQLGFALGASGAAIVANSVGLSAHMSIITAHSSAFWVFFAFTPLAIFACIAGWRLCNNKE